MSLNDIAIPDQPFNQADLAGLGATLALQGWEVMEARQLINLVQQVAAQTALNMAPAILDQVKLINTARVNAVYNKIRMLPAQLGYVSRDRVLQIVQDTFVTSPRN